MPAGEEVPRDQAFDKALTDVYSQRRSCGDSWRTGAEIAAEGHAASRPGRRRARCGHRHGASMTQGVRHLLHLRIARPDARSSRAGEAGVRQVQLNARGSARD